MTPPVWLDARGRRRPTGPCWQCGADTPAMWLRTDDLRRLGWGWCETQRVPNWCGHSQEYVPWPVRRGLWRMVPVWEPAGPSGNPLRRYGPAPAPGAGR